MIFRSRKDRSAQAGVVEHGNGAEAALPPGFSSLEQLLEEIASLDRSNRQHPDPETERRILELRHLAGAALIWGPPADPAYPPPSFDRLPDSNGLPEFSVDELNPELLRAGILTHGCVLVRGLIDRERAVALAGRIERTLSERDATAAGRAGGDDYVQFEPQLGFGIIERPWIEEGGGALAVDSPGLMFEMLSTFDQVGLRDLIRGYLGEQIAISAQKCTLRRADPSVGGAWHQDGSFMRAAKADEENSDGASSTRAFNVWLSLTHCGDEAPGLDIVPRRLDHLVATRTEGTDIPSQVSDAMAREAAGDAGVIRPIFEPGDALLFDALFLHQTGSDPGMPNPRYAIESWFFGASAFPEGYVPLAA